MLAEIICCILQNVLILRLQSTVPESVFSSHQNPYEFRGIDVEMISENMKTEFVIEIVFLSLVIQFIAPFFIFLYALTIDLQRFCHDGSP